VGSGTGAGSGVGTGAGSDGAQPGALGRALHSGLVRISTISPRSLFSRTLSLRGPGGGRRMLLLQVLHGGQGVMALQPRGCS
jgi:hypothetical protein